MSQYESSIPFFEFTQDGLELNQIKTEPEVSTENEAENKDWILFDEKCQIKTEEIEIWDEKFNVDSKDLEGNIVKAASNLESVKLENISNDYDATNRRNTNNSKVATEEETSVAPRKAFKCTLCSYVAILRCQIKEHLHKVHSERRFNCSDCYYAAQTKAYLKKHMLKKHEGKSGKDSSSSKMVTITETSGRSRKVFKCTLCSYTAIKPSRVEQHFVQVHSEIRSFGCPHCNYSAKTKTLLERHLLNKHEDKSGTVKTRKTFKCTHCSYAAYLPCRVRDHFSQVHSDIRSFGCAHCAYAAKTNFSLRAHMLNKHKDKAEPVRKRSRSTATRVSLIPECDKSAT